MKLNLVIGILMLALFGCNEKSDDNKSSSKAPAKKQQTVEATEAFERQNLAGEMDGQAWTFITGRVTAPDEDGKSFLTLWDANIENPCNPTKLGERTVVAKITLEPSRIELGDEQRITFTAYDGELSKVKEVNEGVLKISKIENGQVHGALRAKYNETNYLVGAFEVELCN